MDGKSLKGAPEPEPVSKPPVAVSARALSRAASLQRQAARARDSPIWVPSSEHKTCLVCDKVFTSFVRHHHCHYCGLLVCDDCASKKLVLGRVITKQSPSITGGEAKSLGKQRVCDSCYAAAPLHEMWCALKEAAEKSGRGPESFECAAAPPPSLRMHGVTS